jgi:hypothetical protein
MTVESEVHLTAVSAAVAAIVALLENAGVVRQTRVDEVRETLVASFANEVDDPHLIELFRAELTVMLPPAAGIPHLRIVKT